MQKIAIVQAIDGYQETIKNFASLDFFYDPNENYLMFTDIKSKTVHFHYCEKIRK